MNGSLWLSSWKGILGHLAVYERVLVVYSRGHGDIYCFMFAVGREKGQRILRYLGV